MTATDIAVSVKCYRAGFIGLTLYWMVGFLTARLWGGYAWYASRTGSIYFAMGSLLSALPVALQYILATLYNPEDQGPYLPPSLATFECPADYTGLSPDLFTALLYHYWIAGLAHEFYLEKQMDSPVATALSSLCYLVVCPAIIYFNANSSLLNLLFGALLGIACGLVSCGVITFIFVPRQEAVAEYTQHVGYLAHFDVLKTFRVIN